MSRVALDDFFSSLGPLEEVPEQAVDYPSMTTLLEKKTLYRLAQRFYSGDGIIVDAGLFLGASTNAFGYGIKNNLEAMAKLKKIDFDLSIHMNLPDGILMVLISIWKTLWLSMLLTD